MYCGHLKLITWPIYLDMILWEGYRHIAGMKIKKNNKQYYYCMRTWAPFIFTHINQLG